VRGEWAVVDTADRVSSRTGACRDTEEQGKKAQTQTRIIEAATAFFAEQGFECTSVATIAERAGVSPATVFWHFGDKATLFREVCKRIMVPFVEEMVESVEQFEGRERIFELLTNYQQFVSEHRETIETFVRWFLESPSLRDALHGQLIGLHDAFGRELRRAVEAVVEDGARAAAIAAGLVSTLDGNLLLSLVDTDPQAEKRRSQGLLAVATLAVGLKPHREP
jgi:AcrR family transcriptional regulator